jgi:hypothetical protein
MMEEESIEENWKIVRDAVTSTCQEVLGPKKRNQMGWISGPKLKKIEERKRKKVDINSSRTRGLKNMAQKEYSELHKKVKKYRKEYINKYLEAIASETAFSGNMRDLYSNIRKLAGKFGRPEMQVKDKYKKKIPKKE